MRKELVKICFDFEQKLSKEIAKERDINSSTKVSEKFADFCCDILTKEEQIELATLLLGHMSEIIDIAWKDDKTTEEGE